MIEAMAPDDVPLSVLLIHGPGGIGKSALMREIGRRGACAGCLVVWVDGSEIPGERFTAPYGDVRPALLVLSGGMVEEPWRHILWVAAPTVQIVTGYAHRIEMHSIAAAHFEMYSAPRSRRFSEPVVSVASTAPSRSRAAVHTSASWAGVLTGIVCSPRVSSMPQKAHCSCVPQ